MDKVKEYVGLFFGGRLVVEGNGRTFARLPVWLAALIAVASIRLAVITVLLVVAFGMKVRVTRA
ncbi:MAG: hypothetical protein ACI4MM_07955 [Candidatus Ventricola sp.]